MGLMQATRLMRAPHFKCSSSQSDLRPSNTEPLLRLNLEADSEELMKEKKN